MLLAWLRQEQRLDIVDEGSRRLVLLVEADTVIVCVLLACAPLLSVSSSCTVNVPAPLVVTVAVLPVVPPLKAAMPLPSVRLHW